MTRLTESQLVAVRARGNVLLEAGAGSGKTSTIISRCLDGILREHDPLTVERILMVTFTEAAAAEMRRRLRSALESQQEQSGGSQHLAEQIALLDVAAIGTLHSICLRLIREEGHLLGLDPKPSVMDSAESVVLAGEVFEELFEDCCSGRHPLSAEIQSLVREQLGGERGLRDLVFQLHRYLQSLPDSEGWLEKQLHELSGSVPVVWRRCFHTDLARWAEAAREKLMELEPEFSKRSELLGHVEMLQSAAGDPGETLRAIAAYNRVEAWDKGKATACRKRIKQLLADVEFLASQFPVAGNPEKSPLDEDWNSVRSRVAALLKFSVDFGGRFDRAKRERGQLDFQDIEQHALKLLRDRASGQPTRVALEWRSRFDLVVVDEYQDINGIQDLIIASMGGVGMHGNRFLVGDVKQSIYRFRLADPRIFSRYACEWAGGGAEGRALPLSENFRSHERILQFANAFFSRCMTGGLDGVDYPEQAWLRVGAPQERLSHTAAPGESARVQVWLTRLGEAGETAEDVAATPAAEADKELVEARRVAASLRQFLMDGRRIWDSDSGNWREAGWGDVAILLRSPRGSSWAFAQAFREAGIPLAAGRGSVFDSIEFLDLHGLLSILDNPRQDVPLISVLRSPIGGLSLDELALVRAASPQGLFWEALGRFPAACSSLAESLAGTGSENLVVEAQRKVLDFLKAFERWRFIVRRLPLSECLERILDESGYEGNLQLSQGAGREAVNQLLEMTRRFDQLQGQGLFWFLEWIRERRESLSEVDLAAPTGQTGAVRLMSIHRSKGLEFPIVVLAGLGSQFNLADSRGEVLLDDECGPCLKAVEPRSGRSYPTAAHWLAARRQRQASLGEEMRLLYVAFTRARDWLILSGAGDPEKLAERWCRECTTSALLESARPLDWVGMGLHSFPGRIAWWEQETGSTLLFDWRIEGDPGGASLDGHGESGGGLESLVGQGPSAVQLEEWRSRVLWKYPHRAATLEPAKVSVSLLRRRMVQEELEPVRSMTRSSRRRVAAADSMAVGVATHAVLEHLELQPGTVTEEAVREVVRKLVARGVIGVEEASMIDLDAIVSFWSGPLGCELLNEAGMIRRELPFTSRMSASELAGLGLPALSDGLRDEDGFIVVQGIVDLACIRPAGIRIVDFKTDRIRSEFELREKSASYESQIRLYAMALSRIHGLRVADAWLHFLSAGQSISVSVA